jgi:hypothetical protein
MESQINIESTDREEQRLGYGKQRRKKVNPNFRLLVPY